MVTFVTESANAMKVPTRKYNVTVVNPYRCWCIVSHGGCIDDMGSIQEKPTL